MTDQEVINNYEQFWKEIVENPDGSINKEQLMNELSDFTMLIGNLSKLYNYISGGTVSKPNTKAEAVLGLYEKELKEQYDLGYQDAIDDLCEGDKK